MLNKLFLLIFFCSFQQNIFPKIPAINIFGDSHAFYDFTNDFINEKEHSYYKQRDQKILFRINGFSSRTMHRFGRDKLKFLNIQNHGVQENDIIVFDFGEIDARGHVGKQRDTKNRNLDEIINTLIKRYIEAINLNLQKYRNLHCVIVSITPPSNQKSGLIKWGTLEDRINITKKMNAKLHYECLKNNFIFLDIYDLFANDNGVMIPEKSDGGAHINYKYNHLIKDKLLNLLYPYKLL